MICPHIIQLCPTLCNPMGCILRLLCPWDSPGKNTEVGCHFLLQGIFLTQGSNLCLLHWQVDSLPLSHQGRPRSSLVVQSLSCLTLCNPMDHSMPALLSFSISQNLLKLMNLEMVMPSTNLILCCSLLLPSIFPSIWVFSSESALYIRWPKYWSFSFNISPPMKIQG